jgi:hypothetical protein
VNVELHEHLERVRQRVMWLPTLDLEPLPASTNLLAALLARISSRLDPNRRAEPYDDDDTPRSGTVTKLRQLQTDVAMAWDGNLDERGARLDPYAYGAEVSRVEAARLNVVDGLRAALDELARSNALAGGQTRPLFVLPVDDFDLNPAKSIDLLRLLRMVAAPRLFTLVLGDQDVAERQFRLRLAHEMIGEGERAIEIADRLLGRGWDGQIRELGANAMRVGSGNSGRPIPEILAGSTTASSSGSTPRWRVRPDGPSRWMNRPRSSARSTIAAARSGS